MMTDDDTLASHLLSLLSPANQAKYPLHLAVVQSDKNGVRKLLRKKKTSVDCLYKGVTPLCWAITKGDIEVINLLLQHKAFINLLDDVGRTPLMWAAQARKLLKYFFSRIKKNYPGGQRGPFIFKHFYNFFFGGDTF